MDNGIQPRLEALQLNEELPVIVHVMRHATTQSLVRTPEGDPDIVEKGREQCVKFARTFRKRAKNVTHLFSSPMTRCITTAFLAFSSVVKNGVKVVVLPELYHKRGLVPTMLAAKYQGDIDVSRLIKKWEVSDYPWTDMRELMNLLRWGSLDKPKVLERREVAVILHTSIVPSGVVGRLPNAMIKSYTFSGEILREVSQKEVAEIRKKQMDIMKAAQEKAEKEEADKKKAAKEAADRRRAKKKEADKKKAAKKEADRRKAEKDKADKKKAAKKTANRRKAEKDKAAKSKALKSGLGKKETAKQKNAREKPAKTAGGVNLGPTTMATRTRAKRLRDATGEKSEERKVKRQR